jgi:hypothetical protein
VDEVPPRHSTVNTRLAIVGVVFVLAGSLVVLAFDVVTAIANPVHLRRTISEYGLGAQQWVFAIGVTLLALGSAATALAAVLNGLARARSVAPVAMTAWVVGLLLVVAVPKQDWSNDATLGLGGAVHRGAAAVAFVAIPIAVIAFAVPWVRDGRWASWARATLALACLGVASLVPIFYALIVGAISATPWYRVVTLGYVERVLVVAEVVALVALSLWVRAASNRSASGEELGSRLRACERFDEGIVDAVEDHEDVRPGDR